jgi:hypothetical protein
LAWADPDNDNLVLFADKTSLICSRLKKRGGAFSIIAIGPNYNDNDPENHWNTEPR